MQSGRWSGLNGCWTDTNECKASAISARCCLGVACVVCQRWIRSVYQVRESLLCWSCASILLHNPTGKEQTNDTMHWPLATPLTWSAAQTEGMKEYLAIKINRRVFFLWLYWLQRILNIRTPFFFVSIAWFLGAFAKSRNAPVATSRLSVHLPVCLSVRMEYLGSHWTDFVKFDVLVCF